MIGERLKELRIKKGMTLEEVENLTGIKFQTISKYEKGIISNIPSDKIEVFARTYKVSPAYLMGWIDYENVEDLVKSPDPFDVVKDLLDTLISEKGYKDFEDIPPEIMVKILELSRRAAKVYLSRKLKSQV